MSFRDCIINTFKESAKKGDKTLAGKRKKLLDDTLKKYDDLTEELKKKGINNAEELASKQILEATANENAAKQRRQFRQIQTIKQRQADIEGYVKEGGDVGNALLAMWEYDNKAKYSNIIARRDTIRGRFHAMFNKNLEKYEPKYVGIVRPKAGLENIIKESFGEKHGDSAAKELFDEWANVAEFARKQANRAGANIQKREKWRLPQEQSRVRVAKEGKTAWVNDHMKWVDWDAMRSPDTGLSIKPEDRVRILEKIYEVKITEGAIKANTEISYRSSLAATMAHPRFLEFKDSKSWLEMHNKYGEGSIFDVMVSHLDKMANDIAQMEILGPNPYTAKEQLKAIARNIAAKQDVADGAPKTKALKTQKIEDKLKRFDDLYELFNNSNSASSENFFAQTMAGTRNLLVSMYLGGASLAAIPGDLFTSSMARLNAKHPAGKALTQYLKLMNPASSADRKLAVRLGLIADNATALAYGQQRFIDSVMGPMITRRIADTSLRLSLLSPHTQSAKWAFGMQTLGMFADYRKTPFNKLPFKESLGSHNITEADWDIFRQTNLYKEGKAEFLRPDDILTREDLAEDVKFNLANKFADYIHIEGQYAVPTSSLRARATLAGTTRPGTLIGEIARSFAMFKNFPITILMTHGGRGLSKKTAAGKLAYIAAFGVGMTMMGALATQLRQIRDGKDPLSMNPNDPIGRKFWGQAALTGGGMGIWGDFLFNNLNRFGGGPTETVAGPVVGVGGDLLNLTVGNIMQLAEGKETKFAPELVQFARRHYPGSSIWYGKLIMQRAIWDNLLEEADPQAYRRFKRLEQDAARNYNQSFWWRPGESKPSRKPNLERAFE